MDDADRSWIEKLFKGNRDPATSAADDLAEFLKAHGDAGKAVIAKSLAVGDATTPPEADVDDLELTDADLEALGLTRKTPVAKADSSDMASRLAAIEKRLTALESDDDAEDTSMAKADPVSPDAFTLAKQGVPFEAIEGAKALLEHADKDVREATAAMLVKQADPDRVALLAKEKGSAKIPKADEDEKTAALAALAKQAGEIPANGHSNELAAALATLARNGGGA